MASTDSNTGPVGNVLKKHEWWFKDALDQMECKADLAPELVGEDGEPLPSVIEFYEGRMYRKEGTTPYPPGVWIKIEKMKLECVSNRGVEDRLTVGKKYEVLMDQKNSKTLVVLDDTGAKCGFLYKRFKKEDV